MTELGENVQLLEPDTEVLFTNTDLNIGGGLQQATSKFICPTTGVYEFRYTQSLNPDLFLSTGG